MTLGKLKTTVESAKESNNRILEVLETQGEQLDDAWLSFLIREAWLNIKRAFKIWYLIANKLPGEKAKITLKDFLTELRKII